MGENEKITQKTAEQKAQEHQASNLIDFIIAKTFARHSKMTEEEYLKDIGFENSGKTEDEAIRIAIFNVLCGATKELLQAKQVFNNASALLKTCLYDENIFEDKKGEK